MVSKSWSVPHWGMAIFIQFHVLKSLKILTCWTTLTVYDCTRIVGSKHKMDWVMTTGEPYNHLQSFSIIKVGPCISKYIWQTECINIHLFMSKNESRGYKLFMADFLISNFTKKVISKWLLLVAYPGLFAYLLAYMLVN